MPSREAAVSNFGFKRCTEGKEVTTGCSKLRRISYHDHALILCAVGSSEPWLAVVYKSHLGRNVLRPNVLGIMWFDAEKF